MSGDAVRRRKKIGYALFHVNINIFWGFAEGATRSDFGFDCVLDFWILLHGLIALSIVGLCIGEGRLPAAGQALVAS